MILPLFATLLPLFAAPTLVLQQGTVTGVTRQGGLSPTLQTGPGALLKYMDARGSVFTLSPKTRLAWRIGPRGRTHLTLRGGGITLALLPGAQVLLRHGNKWVLFGPGFHRVVVRHRGPFTLTPPTPPDTNTVAPGETTTAHPTPKKGHRYVGDLCLVDGEAMLVTPGGKPTSLCRTPQNCTTRLQKGRCFSQTLFEPERPRRLFPTLLPLFTAQLAPLDFLALLPSLSRTTKKGGPRREAGADTSTGGGGSMCLNSASGGQGAADVGQSGQTAPTVIPTTQLRLHVSFKRGTP